MNYWSVLVILFGIGSISTEDLRLLDLPPEEAQQYIESKDQTLKYAPKIESNVPAVRVLGETPTNVLEDIYLANQYHGQDGLGGYLYGYAVPDIAKTEKKKAHGDLTGAYQYINGGGQEIKVQYWDDGTGFHQVDNLPEVLPKQVEDSPDVQAAKQEFFKRWHEEAERNSQPIAPSGVTGGLSESSQQQYQPSYQTLPGQYQQGQGAHQIGVGQQDSNTYQPGQNQYQTGQGHYQPGQSSQGQYQPGQTSQGQYQLGHSSQGQYQPGQSSQGQHQGQYQPGQSSQEQYQGGQTSQGQYQPGQLSQGQYLEEQASQGQYQPGQLSQGQYHGGQTSQGQYQPEQSSQGQYQSGQNQYQSDQGLPGQGGYQAGQGGYQAGQGDHQLGPTNQNQPGQVGYQAGQAHTGQAGYIPGQSQTSQAGYQSGQPGYQSSHAGSGYQTDQSQSGQGCCGSADYSGQPSSNQESYTYNQPGKEWEYKATEEETGPPRGFFYNFDYPVGIIVQKQGEAGGVHKRDSLEGIYTQNKANFDEQVRNGASPDGSSQLGYQVHL